MGLEMETAVVMEKPKVTVGSTETGVNMDVGMDSKSVGDTSGNVGAAAGTEVGARADVGVEMALMAVGTCTSVDVEAVAEVQMETIVGSVPSACVAMSKVLVPANAQHGNVGMEMETAVRSGMGVVVGTVEVVVNVHAGMSLEMVAVVEGMSTNMAMSAVLVVGWMEGKTGPCAAFDVNVVGQDINTM